MTTARWEQWVRPPRQQRAHATFERILDAGSELLSERGYEGFSIGEVCRRAGAAPGTLYGRVETKDVLFLVLQDRELGRITTAAAGILHHDGRWRATGPRELVDDVVGFLVEHFAAEEGLLRVFILRAAVDNRVRDEGGRHRSVFEDAVVARLLTRAPDYAVADPERAVRVLTRVLMDSLAYRTAFGPDAPDGVPESPQEWTAQLSGIARAYLLTVG